MEERRSGLRLLELEERTKAPVKMSGKRGGNTNLELPPLSSYRTLYRQLPELLHPVCSSLSSFNSLRADI